MTVWPPGDITDVLGGVGVDWLSLASRSFRLGFLAFTSLIGSMIFLPAIWLVVFFGLFVFGSSGCSGCTRRSRAGFSAGELLLALLFLVLSGGCGTGGGVFTKSSIFCFSTASSWAVVSARPVLEVLLPEAFWPVSVDGGGVEGADGGSG